MSLITSSTCWLITAPIICAMAGRLAIVGCLFASLTIRRLIAPDPPSLSLSLHLVAGRKREGWVRHPLQSTPSFGLLLRSFSLLNDRVRLLLRLRLLPTRPPRPPPPPPPLPPLGFSFGGGRTKAKSTEMVWSRSLVLFRPFMAALASGWVGYSIRAYPWK
jgi:hypothetical protein